MAKKPNLMPVPAIVPQPTLAMPPRDIEVEKLHFDVHNPRLAEVGVEEALSEIEVAQILWRELAADEIFMSIVAAGGFFQHEPLFAEQRTGGEYVVIEGNRRLLAVKLIVDKDGYREKVKAKHEAFDDVTPELIASLEKLPVIVTTRNAIWQYVGFKHVNGPRPWGAMSKAEYIANVHETIKVPLDEIARQIGDRHATVKRLYRGFVVLRQAEEASEFRLDDAWSKRFAFSHLYTALDYPGFQGFLGLKHTDDPETLSKKNLPRLGEVCRWLYGSKRDNLRPVVQSQNPDLRHLDEALRTQAGIDALRAELPLEVARDASLGDPRLFREALVKAKATLEEAQGKCVTGYDRSQELLEVGGAIFKLAENLLDQMEAMKASRPRRTSRGVER